MDLICESCGARQAFDPLPDPRCLECGEPARPATRCFGCHAVVPHFPKCPHCGIPTLPAGLYPAALMLRYRGVDLLSLAERLKALSAHERAELESRYAESWREVDESLDALEETLRWRVNPSMAKLVLANLQSARQAPGMTPEGILHAARATIAAFAVQRLSVAPFSLAACKAIHEAAPWKLSHLTWRLGRAPHRGLDENAVQALASHADALGAAFGPGDGRFAAGAAYLNAFTYAHALVLGECFNRNDSSPLFDLARAASEQGSALAGYPVTLVRGAGVIWAVGKRSTPDLRSRWVPEGYLLIPFKGPSLRLHVLDDLRRFLAELALPIEPRTLPALLHWLSAPFPWDTRLNVEEPGLVERWAALEAGIEDWNFGNRSASKLLGMDAGPPGDRRDELVLRLEPASATLVYRAGELSVR